MRKEEGMYIKHSIWVKVKVNIYLGSAFRFNGFYFRGRRHTRWIMAPKLGSKGHIDGVSSAGPFSHVFSPSLREQLQKANRRLPR